MLCRHLNHFTNETFEAGEAGEAGEAIEAGEVATYNVKRCRDSYLAITKWDSLFLRIVGFLRSVPSFSLLPAA